MCPAAILQYNNILLVLYFSPVINYESLEEISSKIFITKFLSQFIAHDGTPLLNLPYLLSNFFQDGHHMQTGQTKPNWPPYAN